MSYQGWSNYPTWCVSLWLNNDETMYRAKSYLVRRCSHDDVKVADALEKFIEDLLPTLNGFPADLLTYAVGQVDWDEIAKSELED